MIYLPEAVPFIVTVITSYSCVNQKHFPFPYFSDSVYYQLLLFFHLLDIFLILCGTCSSQCLLLLDHYSGHLTGVHESTLESIIRQKCCHWNTSPVTVLNILHDLIYFLKSLFIYERDSMPGSSGEGQGKRERESHADSKELGA